MTAQRLLTAARPYLSLGLPVAESIALILAGLDPVTAVSGLLADGRAEALARHGEDTAIAKALLLAHLRVEAGGDHPSAVSFASAAARVDDALNDQCALPRPPDGAVLLGWGSRAGPASVAYRLGVHPETYGRYPRPLAAQPVLLAVAHALGATPEHAHRVAGHWRHTLIDATLGVPHDLAEQYQPTQLTAHHDQVHAWALGIPPTSIAAYPPLPALSTGTINGALACAAIGLAPADARRLPAQLSQGQRSWLQPIWATWLPIAAQTGWQLGLAAALLADDQRAEDAADWTASGIPAARAELLARAGYTLAEALTPEVSALSDQDLHALSGLRQLGRVGS